MPLRLMVVAYFLCVIMVYLVKGDPAQRMNRIVLSEDKSLSFITIDQQMPKRIPIISANQEIFKDPSCIPGQRSIVFSYKDWSKSEIMKPFCLATIDYDGKNKRILVAANDAHLDHPRVSIKGNLLSYIEFSGSRAEGLSGRLVIYDLQKQKTLKIVQDAYTLSSPWWSENSQTLLFLSAKQDISYLDIANDRINRLGIKARSVIFGATEEIYFLEDNERPLTIYSVRMDGKGKTVVFRKSPKFDSEKHESGSIESLNGFSSDGRYLLYTGYTILAPGSRYYTLELLDMVNKKTFLVHYGLVSGATWCGSAQ